MRRRALWKDFIMEIRNTLNRFLSIFFIVALGVAFFAGIRATDPDMRLTADYYFDDSSLMDIRILSTLGLTEEDAEAISGTEGVEEAEAAYSTHVVTKVGSYEIVLEVMSLPEKLNLLTVTEGRLPEKNNEVLADAAFIASTGLAVGDTFQIFSGSEQPLSDTLGEDEYTIVGTGTTPYYLSFQRGNSEIGNGKVSGFIAALPEVFSQEVYSSVYVSVQGAEELTVYTDEYDRKVDTVVERIKNIAGEQEQKRYSRLYNEANDRIMEARQKLEAEKSRTEEELDKKLAELQYGGLGEEQLLEAARTEADDKFWEAQEEIDRAAAELVSLEKPKWYVLDRNSIEAYVEFGQNADRIGSIGKVFPVIFYLVAALISLTTMTRMVEEERIQIGTLKALGYSGGSIAMKYMLYALLATLGGSLAGAAVGLKVLPLVIITAYKILYGAIPKVVTPFNLYYAALAAASSVLTVGIATYLACYKELLAKPAQLMRPEAPKSGKRVFLERIPGLWKRFGFTWKATVRNLLRYKKRFYMTIFGIGGCMALLLVGFGLKDSIFVIADRQFSEIMRYEASVSFDTKAPKAQIEELEAAIKENAGITAYVKIRDTTAEITHDGITKTVTMFLPEDEEEFGSFIVLRDRVGHKPHTLESDGIILTEHIAKKINAGVGDTIIVKLGSKEAEVKISAITENYLTHYLYMSPKLYERLFAEEAEYNEYLLKMPGTGEAEQLEAGNSLLSHKAAVGAFYISYYRSLLANVLVSLDIVVWVLIVSAGALAFVVLYNLNNININERRRELTTLKVLGFYSKEMAAYVYRENIVLTVIGIIFGIGLGILLHRFVILTIEIDLVMFGRNIDLSSFVYGTLLTILFSAFVNFVMFFKLKRIDMVESLKSIE